MRRFHPFRVRRCDYAGEAFSVPAPSAPPNSPESDCGTACSKPRSDPQESRASKDDSNGDRGSVEDQSAGFGLQQSEPVPGWRSVARAQHYSGCAATRGGQFPRSGATTNRGKDGIPGSKGHDGNEMGVCWRDVRGGWARPDAAQKPVRTRRRPEIPTEKLALFYPSRSGLKSLDAIARTQGGILNHGPCLSC